MSDMISARQLLELNVAGVLGSVYEYWGGGELEPGETESSSYFHMPTSNGELVLFLENAANGDAAGTTGDVANFRVLKEEYEEHLLEISYDNGEGLAVILDGEIPTSLYDLLDGLRDYALIDEERVSEVDDEVIADNWESWAERDIRHAIHDVFVENHEDEDDTELAMQDAFDDEVDEDAIFDRYMAWCEIENLYVQCENATDATFPEWERFAQEEGEAYGKHYVARALAAV